MLSARTGKLGSRVGAIHHSASTHSCVCVQASGALVAPMNTTVTNCDKTSCLLAQLSCQAGQGRPLPRWPVLWLSGAGPGTVRTATA